MIETLHKGLVLVLEEVVAEELGKASMIPLWSEDRTLTALCPIRMGRRAAMMGMVDTSRKMVTQETKTAREAQEALLEAPEDCLQVRPVDMMMMILT